MDEIRGYRVWWDAAAGVARTQWLAGARCGIEEARAVDAEVKALGQGKVLLLVDLREVASIDRPAREFFMKEHAPYLAVALLAGSPSTRMLTNFFLGLGREPIPVKMFTVEAAALAWLQAQR